MKNRFLFLLAIAAMLFACSEDSTFADLTKSADETTLNSEMDKGNNGKAVTRPFKLKGSGTLTYEPSDSYGGSYYATVQGEGNGTHVGLFTISLNWYAVKVQNEPPIYAPITLISGFMTAANGDILNSYLSDFDPNGEWYEYTFLSGTGRFEYVEGVIKLYQNTEMLDALNGVYSNYGEGWIKY